MNIKERFWTINTTANVLDRIVSPQVSRVGFSVTNGCNLRCKTCDIWRRGVDRYEITNEEVDIFSKKNSYPLWIGISGGEPTTREDFGQFLSSLSRIKSLRFLNMNTNGQRPGYLKDCIGSLLDSMNQRVKVVVAVSFEGLEVLHDEITGKKGAFQSSIRSFEVLIDLARDDWRLEPRIEYTISKYNRGSLIPTYQYFKERYNLSLGYFNVGIAMEVPYYSRNGNRFQIEDQDLKKELGPFLDMYTLKDKANVIGLTGYICLKKSLQEKKPETVGLDYSVLIGPNWNVYPSMFQLPNYPVGNLRNYDFDLKKLLKARVPTYFKGGSELWTQCDSYPALIFKPWRLL